MLIVDEIAPWRVMTPAETAKHYTDMCKHWPFADIGKLRDHVTRECEAYLAGVWLAPRPPSF